MIVVRREKPTMSRPTESQAGAFFGILASALMLVLTVMALGSMSPAPRHHPHISAGQMFDEAPAGAATIPVALDSFVSTDLL